MPSRFAVIPRRGGPDDIRWFEADPTFVLHFTNAYEDGDEIVLDGFYEGDPAPVDSLTGDKWEKAFRFLALDRLQTRLRRWRFNLVTGATTEEQLTDSITEFGMINAGYAGRDYRYTYAATGKPGWFLFDGLVKHDLHTGAEERFAFDDGVYGSESAMAPRVGSTGEDDGYLVTLTTDMTDDASYCLVFDAARVADGPVCKLQLPERISSGTHSTWADGSSLRRWHETDDAACRDRDVGGQGGAQRRRSHAWAARRRVDAAGDPAGADGRDPLRRIPVAPTDLAFGAVESPAVAVRRRAAGTSDLPDESAALRVSDHRAQSVAVADAGVDLELGTSLGARAHRRLARMHHTVCDDDFVPQVTCRSCSEPVSEKDIVAQWGPTGSWARSVPAAATRRRSATSQAGLFPQTMTVLGNRWAFALLVAAFVGISRFTDFQNQLGAPPGSVADRLSIFAANGVLVATDNRYRLTEKGRGPLPRADIGAAVGSAVVPAPEGPAVVLTHTACGRPFTAVLTCDQCTRGRCTGAGRSAPRGLTVAVQPELQMRRTVGHSTSRIEYTTVSRRDPSGTS